MIKEVAHLLVHAPRDLALMWHTPQAEVYDVVLARANAAGLDERRAELVEDLDGEVLEIGCGTGMMFPHYRASATVTALEPKESFLERARPRAERAAATITAGIGDGMSLPFEAGRFDAVVFGLVLCSVPDVERVLAEAQRVLKPGGRLRLLEHVRSERRVAGALMDLFDPIWLRLNRQGCHMNRDPVPLLARAGFRVEAVSPFQIFSPGMPAFPIEQIWAIRE